MRTFRWNAPIIIGAGALVVLLFAPAPLPLRPGRAERIGCTPLREASNASLGELKARLERSDRVRGD